MPTDTGFLRYDLTRLLPCLAEGSTVLTPNFRLARRIKAAWDARQQAAGLSSWTPVAVFPVEAYLQEQWRQALMQGKVPARRLLSGLQLRELWQQVIQSDAATQERFSLMQPGAAAELAQDAREQLLRACVPYREAAARSEFSLDLDCETFYRWLQGFEQRLAALEAASRADLFADLRDADVAPVTNRILLLDFDEIPALYRRCLRGLAIEVGEINGARGEALPVVRSFPDRQAELDAVASWAAAEYRGNPRRSIGIVLADMGDRAGAEYALRREFDCLGENYTALPVNFSSGITLDRAPVVRDALRMLATVQDRLSLEEVRGLLCSRYVAPSDRDSSVLVDLLEELYGEGRTEVDTGRLRFLAQREGRETLSAGAALRAVDLMRLRRERLLPSAWVPRLEAVLDAWGWPGAAPLDSLEYQQVEQWHQVLDQFAAADALTGRQSFVQALNLLQRCCREQISQPQTQDSPVQVLGPLEGAGLHFDALWMCGLQGSRWPAPLRPNPFLPGGLQRRFGMPHSSSEREWAYAHSLLDQYRGACGELRISYARQVEGVPELPSPLLEGFSIEHLEGGSAVPESWLQRQRTAQVEQLRDDWGPPVAPQQREQLSGGSTILQNQAACPFRAFARGRLGLEPLGQATPGLSAADRGNLLHNALYALWGEIGSSETLAGLEQSDLPGVVRRAASAALEAAPGGLKQLVGMACLELEQQRLERLLLEWLAVEAAREPFVVRAREEPLAFEIGGLPLSLRVDRVDDLGDGRRLVIDYKSGRTNLSTWLGERLSQPQLPLYGLATGVDGIAFAQVRPRDCRFNGLGNVTGVLGVQDDIARASSRSATQARNWEELLLHWRAALEGLARAFLEGNAAVDPEPNACNYCGMQALCRIELEAGT